MKKKDVEKVKTKRPLVHDELTQAITMADFYSYASKNIVPELYIKRIVKDIKAKDQHLLSSVGVTIMFHTDEKVGYKDLKEKLKPYDGGVNFEIFLRNKDKQIYCDVNFKKHSKDEVLKKIKGDWSIHTDNGRGIFIFDFDSFSDADKAFGLSSLSVGNKLSLMKEIVDFEKMIADKNFSIPDYITIKEVLDKGLWEDVCKKRPYQSPSI